MGARIDDQDQALRLARAILSDVTLYNEQRIREARALPEDLADEIAEARLLFASRVTERHHALFETQLAELIRRLRPDLGSPAAPPVANMIAAPRSAETVYRDAALRTKPEATPSMPSSSTAPVASLVAVALAIVGAVAWWLMQH